MSVGGVIELFRGRPRDPIGEGGRMSLGDHFRELRARVMRITLYLVVGTIIALFFYDFLFQLILDPYNQARQMLGQGTQTQAVITGVGTPLLLQLKLCGVAAIVATSPLWLHEIWGFVVPGLHRNERRWTRIFAITAGPLFIAGVALGYYVLPKGIAALIGFTPDGVTQLTEFGAFFSFITRMLLVFGIAFEIPLFLIMLNLAGVVSGKSLGRHRPWIIVGTFVFAAVATPSTDPYSMLMLALPMLVLVVISEVHRPVARPPTRPERRGRVRRRRRLAPLVSRPVAVLGAGAPDRVPACPRRSRFSAIPRPARARVRAPPSQALPRLREAGLWCGTWWAATPTRPSTSPTSASPTASRPSSWSAGTAWSTWRCRPWRTPRPGSD